MLIIMHMQSHYFGGLIALDSNVIAHFEAYHLIAVSMYFMPAFGCLSNANFDISNVRPDLYDMLNAIGLPGGRRPSPGGGTHNPSTCLVFSKFLNEPLRHLGVG